VLVTSSVAEQCTVACVLTGPHRTEQGDKDQVPNSPNFFPFLLFVLILMRHGREIWAIGYMSLVPMLCTVWIHMLQYLAVLLHSMLIKGLHFVVVLQ